MADSSRLGPALAALSAITARRWELGPATNKVSAERGVAVRMRDGAVLLADHYAPVTSGPRPTVLTAPVSYRVFHSGPRPSAITMPVLAPAREVGEGSIPDGDGTQARETSR
jgi:predicted acyl esterase